jgi:hypothetical protein
MDVATTKLMSVHIEALLPPTSIEIDVPQNIQVAALLGIGLLFEGTAHRHIAEVLLSEIGNAYVRTVEQIANAMFSSKKLSMFVRNNAMLGGIPVPTAWRVLGLRMEERPPDMEASCEYIE